MEKIDGQREETMKNRAIDEDTWRDIIKFCDMKLLKRIIYKD